MPLAVLPTVEGLHVPVILFVDVVGKAGTASPEQILSVVPKLNVGVMFGATVTVNVVGLAHTPGLGVNVYTPEFWLSTVAALHVPATPFVDVFGNAGTAPPAHMLNDVPKLNVGVVRGVTVIFIVTGNAHCPAAGVNVYEPLAVLLTVAGFQVPVSPLLDVAGNKGAVVPAQNAGMAVNEGTMIGFERITPENKFVVLPFSVIVNPAYTPAFNPVIVTWPAPLATSVTGPTALPSSV